jgi:hypothetical protein
MMKVDSRPLQTANISIAVTFPRRLVWRWGPNQRGGQAFVSSDYQKGAERWEICKAKDTAVSHAKFAWRCQLVRGCWWQEVFERLTEKMTTFVSD